MKTVQFLIISCILLIASGCASYKNGLIQAGGIDGAIKNAILDFSNTPKLFKKGSVFSVTAHAKNDNDQLIVRIGENNMKFLLSADTKVGEIGGIIPTRFLEKKGKLIFWWDEKHPLTNEALEVYRKYNLLQNDEGGIITIPDFLITDNKKSAHYYFCRNDLTNFKRVITSRGIGIYDPPNLNCN